jgi:hypothetical protein
MMYSGVFCCDGQLLESHDLILRAIGGDVKRRFCFSYNMIHIMTNATFLHIGARITRRRLKVNGEALSPQKSCGAAEV